MTVYLFLVGAVALILGSMWLANVRGPVLMMTAAVMLFGCAGYAIQGTPTLAGAPREGQKRAAPMSLVGARQALLGQFDYSDNWLNMADALASRGNSEDAARLLAAQVEKHPGDFKLWIGLGNALADHSQTLSPAARLAFIRAQDLAPGHPAPAFFLGLAEARSGNPEMAAQIWREILRNAPEDASWRPMVEQGLQAIGGGEMPPPTAKNQTGS